MNERFMKIKRIAIPTITMVLIACQLFGCAATSQDETLNLIQQNEMIEIEIAVPDNYEKEQGTEEDISWGELALYTTYKDTLRYPMEQVLGVEFNGETFTKTGMLYEKNDGTSVQNNTLKDALQNNKFKEVVDNEDIISQISDIAADTFADLESDEEMTNFYMAINAYFNLLPGTEEGYANPQSVLTRAEFMTMVFRAETPYESYLLHIDNDFATAVGESKYNGYAQHLADYSYLTLADKSLNNQTYNGNISRGEAIYMLMSKYYADELKAVDTSKANLEDTKDGGDIAKAQGYTKDYGKSYEIVYSINNPDAGVPTDIYKALVLAESKGLIDSETRFDEAITLEESVELLVNIYKTLPAEKVEDTNTGVNEENGTGSVALTDEEWLDIINNHPERLNKEDFDGDGLTLEIYEQKMKDGTLTWEDMANLDYGDMSDAEYQKRTEDGIIYGDMKYRENGAKYIVLDDGTIIESGDKLPDGAVFVDSSQW